LPIEDHGKATYDFFRFISTIFVSKVVFCHGPQFNMSASLHNFWRF
jgi:hypothetical protein